METTAASKAATTRDAASMKSAAHYPKMRCADACTGGPSETADVAHIARPSCRMSGDVRPAAASCSRTHTGSRDSKARS